MMGLEVMYLYLIVVLKFKDTVTLNILMLDIPGVDFQPPDCYDCELLQNTW